MLELNGTLYSQFTNHGILAAPPQILRVSPHQLERLLTDRGLAFGGGSLEL